MFDESKVVPDEMAKPEVPRVIIPDPPNSAFVPLIIICPVVDWVSVALPIIPFLIVLVPAPENVNAMFTSNFPLITVALPPPGVPGLVVILNIGIVSVATFGKYVTPDADGVPLAAFHSKIEPWSYIWFELLTPVPLLVKLEAWILIMPPLFTLIFALPLNVGTPEVTLYISIPPFWIVRSSPVPSFKVNEVPDPFVKVPPFSIIIWSPVIVPDVVMVCPFLMVILFAE